MELDKEKYQEYAREYLEYEFNDVDRLIEALTHSSFANENRELILKDNQRLEFLGDAILEAIISEKLYVEENFDEGAMTKIRSLTVREESLVAAANKINLTEMLLLGQGEEKTLGRLKSSNAEDAMEAVIGAIFIDSNWDETKKFINRVLKDTYKDAKSGNLVYDYKSKLYQVLQAKENLPQVEFRLINESGPAHDKSFTIAVYYNGDNYGEASASNKKLAEQEAARIFLETYREED